MFLMIKMMTVVVMKEESKYEGVVDVVVVDYVDYLWCQQSHKNE